MLPRADKLVVMKIPILSKVWDDKLDQCKSRCPFLGERESGSGNDIFEKEHTHRLDLGVQQSKKEHTPD